MTGYKRINSGFKNHTSRLQMTVTRYADEGILSAHFHSSAELIYVTVGKIDVKVNNKSIKLYENEFLLIMPDILHEISYGSVVDFWVKEVELSEFANLFKVEKLENLVCIKFHCDKITEMRYCNICLEPQRVFNHRIIEGYESEESIDNMLYSEYYSAMRDVINICLTDGEKMCFFDDNERFINSILEYISANFLKHCSASLFGKINGIPDFTVRNKVKSVLRKYGFSYAFSDLVYIRRTEHAKHLLKTTEIPLKKVAIASGFLNDSRMNKLFTRYAGIRPLKYREITAKIMKKELFEG